MDWTSDYYLYEKIASFLKENDLDGYFDPHKFCRSKGWNLISYDSGDYLKLTEISVDGFSIYDNNEYYIFYNPYSYAPRINFTLSHEIGHIVLLHHFLIPNKILMSSRSKDSIWERQANIFARNILMPAKNLKQMIDTGCGNHIGNEEYGVSKKAFEVRLKTLYKDLKMLSH